MSINTLISWRDNMSIIRPFKAYIPNPSIVKDLAGLPYDVLTSNEARKMVSENEYSFLHVSKAEIDLPRGTNVFDQKVYDKARENLDNMIEKKYFLKQDQECFYIYRLKMDDNEQTGLAVIASIDDYIEENIKKHEHVHDEKVIDRLKLLESTEANTDPVFMTYKSHDSINKTIEDWIVNNDPIYDFIALDEVEHTIWIIDDQDTISGLIDLFQGVKNLFIADGHHISEAAVRYGLSKRKENPNYNKKDGFNFFLSVLFPDKDLCILDYNRVIRDLNGYSDSEFIEILKENFHLSPHDSYEPYRPERKHTFGMFLAYKWYELIAKDHLIDGLENPLDKLDVTILKNNILEGILELYNGGDRIKYVGGNRGLRELEFKLQDEMKVAFSLYPTTVEDFLEIAGSNKMMPYKSTWFEPKLRGGLFLRKLKTLD